MSEALSEPQNLVVFQLLHEVGKTPGMFASREEVLNGNPQYLREEHEVFVVHKRSRASIFETPLQLMSKLAS
jgi:hypothetical protein